MINLIPPKGHTALMHEYVLRVISVYGFMLAGVFLASAALMIPTYVLTSSQLTGAQSESSKVEETKAAFNEAFGEIKVANTVMAQLKKEVDVTPVSTVVEEIVRLAPRGIQFTTFMVAKEGNVLTEIQVQGIASDRSTLSSFKNTLEASAYFSQALVPISDLAHDTKLPFVVTVSLENQTASTTP